MLQVNVHDAKARFSKILARVQIGETIVIAKSGRPVARLVPFQGPSVAERRFGTVKKTVHLLAGWSSPLPEKILDAFES